MIPLLLIRLSSGAQAAAVVATTSGGWAGYVAYQRYRDDEEVRRERVARGIIPDDMPAADAEAVREASRQASALLARRKLRQLRRDAEDLAYLGTLTERLMAAQREADEQAYADMVGAIETQQALLRYFNHEQNAKAVLLMLGLL